MKAIKLMITAAYNTRANNNAREHNHVTDLQQGSEVQQTVGRWRQRCHKCD